MAPFPRDPAEDLTITEATNRLIALGFNAQMAAAEAGTVKCFACGTQSPASEFKIEMLIRSEGASDPDDMVASVAVECPSCHSKGVLTLKYGPEASLEDQEVLSTLETA